MSTLNHQHCHHLQKSRLPLSLIFFPPNQILDKEAKYL
uniref:Uncharacterized protein n=1 Tax=Rhizophora mucronata TaxID=61149 RepID=A0A2P2QSA7_RHIMU